MVFLLIFSPRTPEHCIDHTEAGKTHPFHCLPPWGPSTGRLAVPPSSCLLWAAEMKVGLTVPVLMAFPFILRYSLGSWTGYSC